jgi:hypothetical protein
MSVGSRRAFSQGYLDKVFLTFFGVTFGPDGLEGDMQQPQLFEEWKNRRVQ